MSTIDDQPFEPETLTEGAMRLAYPSDLSDAHWRKLRPIVTPPVTLSGRPRTTDLREVLSALRYRWKTGCVWRMLPHDFPPWQTVHMYEQLWRELAVIDEVRHVLGLPREAPESSPP